jgi:YYY domain-containing protein
MGWQEAALRWYVLLAALTWALAPGVRWLCASLADRGVSLARPLALLATLFPVWLLAAVGMIPFTTIALELTAVVLGIAGWSSMLRREGLDRLWLRRLLWTEIASLALFALYVWLRGFTPDISGTEKPMDIAFLASSALTTDIPVPDPWFAGQPINYYYLGYLLFGSVSRLAGVSAATGFNLALASIFSMALVASFGAAWNAARPWLGARAAAASGLIASFAIVIAGNLYAPLKLLAQPAATTGAWWWDSAVGIGWRSSRIVCDGPRVAGLCQPPSVETINEFPAFSLLLGDLHPHLMALPFTLVAIGLAWNLVLASSSEPNRWSKSWLARVASTGVVIGALYPLNAWDFPTFLLVAVGALLAGAGWSFAQSWRRIALLAAVAVVAWLPFWVVYVPPTSSAAAAGSALLSLPVIDKVAGTLAVYSGQRTSLTEYLTIFGAAYAFGVALVAVGMIAGEERARRVDLRAAAIAAALTLIPAVLLGAPVIPLCGVPLALALVQLRRTQTPDARLFALALLCGAWALSIGVELVYIRDAFNDRMNTLFKFYYQTWTLYGLAAAVAIPLLWHCVRGRAPARAALAAGTVAALLAGLAYPVVASYQWTNGFAVWHGLDGLAYGAQTDADDVAAIRWLAAHAAPGDVVLEAAGCSYRPFSRLPFNRVAAFSGVPTVIGWGDNHQRQWRAGEPALLDEIGPRQSDVARMYADPSSPLIARYGIDWLFVGDYERGNWQGECPTAGPYAGLDQTGYPGRGWEEAFRSGETRLFRRTSAWSADQP